MKTDHDSPSNECFSWVGLISCIIFLIVYAIYDEGFFAVIAIYFLILSVKHEMLKNFEELKEMIKNH